MYVCTSLLLIAAPLPSGVFAFSPLRRGVPRQQLQQPPRIAPALEAFRFPWDPDPEMMKILQRLEEGQHRLENNQHKLRDEQHKLRDEQHKLRDETTESLRRLEIKVDGLENKVGELKNKVDRLDRRTGSLAENWFSQNYGLDGGHSIRLYSDVFALIPLSNAEEGKLYGVLQTKALTSLVNTIFAGRKEDDRFIKAHGKPDRWEVVVAHTLLAELLRYYQHELEERESAEDGRNANGESDGERGTGTDDAESIINEPPPSIRRIIDLPLNKVKAGVSVLGGLCEVLSECQVPTVPLPQECTPLESSTSLIARALEIKEKLMVPAKSSNIDGINFGLLGKKLASNRNTFVACVIAHHDLMLDCNASGGRGFLTHWEQNEVEIDGVKKPKSRAEPLQLWEIKSSETSNRSTARKQLYMRALFIDWFMNIVYPPVGPERMYPLHLFSGFYDATKEADVDMIEDAGEYSEIDRKLKFFRASEFTVRRR